MQQLYQSSSTITGELEERATVGFKRVLTPSQRKALTLWMSVVLLTSVVFMTYLFHSISLTGFGWLSALAVGAVVLLEAIRLIQAFTLFSFAFAAKDPMPMQPQSHLRVAVLTTIVPSKEPFALVAKTLQAMKAIDAPNGSRVHVWVLDEGNDPAIRARCKAMGVRYFSRHGLAGWNTQSGAYKARTKHGNHNAWRRAHEHDYDIVAQMDPDHVPRHDFLWRTLGYFRDPSIAFVVAPQVYGNIDKSWIARAAAFQSYVFHGIIQRGGNGMQAPLLIGTNHLYRTKAFRQINGYQDSIIEDHLTSMAINSAMQSDGHAWRGVYTPDILAVGEGPTSFTDYFNQQKRWAYGIWEIMLRWSPHYLRKMSGRQAGAFMMLQFFYPSVAVSWVLSVVTSLLFGLANVQYHGVTSVAAVLWTYSILSSLAMFYWLRSFNLVAHERQTWGLGGIGLLLMCMPVYVAAAIQALSGRRLTYAVTAKGKLTSVDSLRTFYPHLTWLSACLFSLLLFGLRGDNLLAKNIVWTYEQVAICLAPVVLFLAQRLRSFVRRSLKLINISHRQRGVAS